MPDTSAHKHLSVRGPAWGAAAGLAKIQASELAPAVLAAAAPAGNPAAAPLGLFLQPENPPSRWARSRRVRSCHPAAPPTHSPTAARPRLSLQGKLSPVPLAALPPVMPPPSAMAATPEQLSWSAWPAAAAVPAPLLAPQVLQPAQPLGEHAEGAKAPGLVLGPGP